MVKKVLCRTCGQEVPHDTANALIYATAGMILVDVKEEKQEPEEESKEEPEEEDLKV